MRLEIPTNWDDSLIDIVSEFPVTEMYGNLQETPIGGGRPPAILPKISKDDAVNHIKKVREKGIVFNYLLNSPCLANKEYDPVFKEKIIDHIKWACDIGAQSVTVASPFLLKLVKTHVPQLKVTASIYGFIDTVEKAKYYESLGADEITIDLSSNRKFKFLKEVYDSVKCTLKVLVNQTCLYQCPYSAFHSITSGHESQEWNENRGLANAYCMIKCTLEKLKNPEELIKSRWIRPEDLIIYEELGYDLFKIAGRDMSTEWIRKVTEAYTNRRFDGNLLDLLNAAFITFPGAIGDQFDEIKKPYIDNRKLDGFLETFKQINCENECFECTYCKEISKDVVTVFKKENQEITDVLHDIIEATFIA